MSYNIKVRIRKYDQESKVMVTEPTEFTVLFGLEVNARDSVNGVVGLVFACHLPGASSILSHSIEG